MADPFLAEIRIFAGNFAPQGWATCDGQLMAISQNTALFSLVGTYYGGDGKVTFGLPNLAGSAAVGAGQGQGLSYRSPGDTGGEPYVTLLGPEMPAHNHNFAVRGGNATQGTLAPDVVMGRTASGGTPYQSNTSQNLQLMDPGSLSLTGSSQPHNNLQPYLGLTFIIALQGIFPPRS
jgi:microcystin-dependent protein